VTWDMPIFRNRCWLDFVGDPDHVSDPVLDHDFDVRSRSGNKKCWQRSVLSKPF